MSMDEGVANGVGAGPSMQQLYDREKMGSRKQSKNGRRSSTTQEESHGNDNLTQFEQQNMIR